MRSEPIQLSAISLAVALLLAGPALAQRSQPAAHAGHGATPRREQQRGPEPVLPEGVTLGEMLDYAAEPPPDSWPTPVHDNATYSFSQLELLEYRVSESGGDELGWDAQGWIGDDDHKFWWKTEGEAVFDGPDEGEADLQLLHATPLSPFWYLQAGIRYEQAWEPGSSLERFAAVLGVQGIAPYNFDLEPILFLTEDGDVLAELTASYNLYLTQRLVLVPRVELNASAQDVPESGLGDGLNSGSFDLRLLYEVRREFAPYLGVRSVVLSGETADLAEQRGAEDHDLMVVVGARTTF